MQNWNEILETWRAIPATHIKRSSIKIDDALQPRSLQAVAFKQRDSAKRESENNVAALANRLKTTPDLDPILVAEIEGALYVVDGHHRLKAYKGERKQLIPAKVKQTDWKTAVTVSKLVNLDHRALPLHKDQAREACWQYLALITSRGLISLGETSSCRKVAAQFGVSPDTVHRMTKAMPLTNVRNFRRDALDTGTQWPLWRYCKGNAEPFGDISDHLRANRQAEKIAILFNKAAPEINTLALLKLLKECVIDSEELPPPLPELIAHYSR